MQKTIPFVDVVIGPILANMLVSHDKEMSDLAKIMLESQIDLNHTLYVEINTGEKKKRLEFYGGKVGHYRLYVIKSEINNMIHNKPNSVRKDFISFGYKTDEYEDRE